MDSQSNFAKRVFQVAGIYGIIVLLPQYLVESSAGLGLETPIGRPEHFYGFVGVALVWQFAFLLIATDVRRYRPMMLIGVLEKLSFGIATIVLYLHGRVAASVLSFGLIDLILGGLFVAAFWSTRESGTPA